MFPSISYISLNYKDATKVLKFSIFYLYSIPTHTNSHFPIISSEFTSISDAWLPSSSKFKFSDSVVDAQL